MSGLHILAPAGVGEVVDGDDLTTLLLDHTDLHDGDIVVVTSKVVSKAEGRVRGGDRDEAIEEETVRVVARRGPTSIVRTRHGLTMAAAGVDASNVETGRVVLLPVDPDASARRMRDEVLARTGTNVAVIITDTAGRAWRTGQTDIAIGAAGLTVTEDFAGQHDPYGNQLAVTLSAVADEIAGAAELAKGKLGGRPFAVVRGRDDLVLAAGEHGTGAVALVREDGMDMFGYGAREAVARALAGDPADQTAFGATSSVDDIAAALVAASSPSGYTSVVAVPSADGAEIVLSGVDGLSETAVRAVCFAHGWIVDSVVLDGSSEIRVGMSRRTP